MTSIELIVEVPSTTGRQRYFTSGETLTMMMSARLPASAMLLRQKLHASGYTEVPSGLGVSDYLIIMSALYDEGVTIP